MTSASPPSRLRRILNETGIVGLLLRTPARLLIAGSTAAIRLTRQALGRVPGSVWTTAASRQALARNRELADRHRGGRCVILGNGPSVQPEDLALVKGEVLFSCNQGYQLLARHGMTPAYHAVVDPEQLRSEYDGMLDDLVALQMRGATILAGEEMAAALRRRSAGGALYELRQFLITDHVIRPAQPLPDLTQSQFGYLSVVHMAIHCALYMGFSKIVLIGCDMDFFIDPEAPFRRGFEPRYGPVDEPTTRLFGWDQIALMEWCLREFRAFAELGWMAEAKGAVIVNAGRGGALNVYPRMPLAEALERAA